MPSRAQHLEQARGNREHARFLVGTHPTDRYALQWAVTAAFYAAVHGVEAHLASMGQHSTDHLDRERRMRAPANRVPPAVYRAYNRLKNRSQGARYHLWTFTADEVERTIIDRDLAVVARFAGL